MDTSFIRYNEPENCNAFRDKQVLDSVREMFKDWDNPRLANIVGFIEFYNDKIPKIEKPNCRINSSTKEILTRDAPGFDINSLNNAISNVDYQNITLAEDEKSKLLKVVVLGTIPFINVVLPPLMLMVSHHKKEIGELTAYESFLPMFATAVATLGTIAFAISARLNKLTSQTQTQTEKQIAIDLQEFIRSENISLNY